MPPFFLTRLFYGSKIRTQEHRQMYLEKKIHKLFSHLESLLVEEIGFQTASEENISMNQTPLTLTGKITCPNVFPL